jgi:hypothetical protein
MLLLIFLATMMIACTSGNLIKSKTAVAEANVPEAMCNQIVRYHIEKAYVTNENGEEKEDNTAVALTFDPGEGHLQMKGRGNEGEVGEGSLKLISCNLTAGMKSGEAVYEFTEEKQRPDGTKKVSTVTIKVKASNGSVLISFSSPERAGGMKMTPARWEVVNESDRQRPETSRRQSNDGGWSIDATKQSFSKDSIVKGDYTLLFYVQSPNFDSTVKRRMIETFFTVYPRQVEHYNPKAPKTVVFLVDPTYKDVAAALGNMVRYSPEWFAQNPEDIDVVTHEVMHVVQGYNYATVPFWVTEGIADYARSVYGLNNEKAKWELQKPVAQSHYQNGYKITARFFFWLEEQYKLEFVNELNSVAAAKAYTDNFWQAKFGKTVGELWDEYRAVNNLEPQPAQVQMITFMTRSQVLDSLRDVYAARDAGIKSRFEITGEFQFAPNVILPSGYPEGSSDKIFWYRDPVFAGRRHTLINQTIKDALSFANEYPKMAVVYDSARLFPALDGAIFRKRYCFDIMVPKEKGDSLEAIFIAKINDHFKISSRVDSIERTVLVLQKVGGFVFNEPDKKAVENTNEVNLEQFKQGIVAPYILIANYLENYTKLPIVDETGTEKAYNFGFRPEDEIVLKGAESKEVGERLKQHGLQLVKAVRKYPTLFISRK